MNKFLIAVIVLLVGIVWWSRRTPEESPKPPMVAKIQAPSAQSAPPPAPHPAPVVAQGKPPPVVTAQAPTLGQTSKTAPPQKPPKGMVQFVIKEGVAVSEGDIVLGKLEEGQNVKEGVSTPRPNRLWQTNEIPYSIQAGVTQTAAIEQAIAEIHRTTPVRFIPYQNQVDSIVFVPAAEICASYLGRSGAGQPIYLGPNCGVNEILHELMHALGFVHEHSRPDRDNFLEVQWKNIEEKNRPQFWVIPDNLIHEYVGSVFSFDPESTMLYGPHDFAISPELFSLKSRTGSEINPSRGHLSRVDQERVTYLYGR